MPIYPEDDTSVLEQEMPVCQIEIRKAIHSGMIPN
jgi:hypothetical protein